ncbi:hypothetical protein GCM10027018_07820 [Paenibacillus thermoaerophilus]
MWSTFNELISLEVLIWLLPAAFLIHDLEEIVTTEKWLRKLKDQPRIAENRMFDWEKNITFQFALAVLLLGSILLPVTWLTANHFENSGNLHPLFVGINAILFLDGLKHVGYTFMLKKYTPGFVTAGLVEIPFTAYALYRFYGAGKLDLAAAGISMAVELPLVVFLVWAGLTLGRRLRLGGSDNSAPRQPREALLLWDLKYINYYNPKRIKAKLKSMSPVQYRTHALESA